MFQTAATMIRYIKRMSFRMAFRVLLMALILKIVQGTKAEVNLVNLEVNCYGRCGENSLLPCSCHPKCFVFKNCCEYILQSCPHMLTSALELYGHLVDAQVVCEIKRIAMISSCPYTYRKRRSAPTISRLKDTRNSDYGSTVTDSKRYKSNTDTKSIRSSGEKLQSKERLQRDVFGHLGNGEDGVHPESFRTKRDAEESEVIINAVKNAPVYDSSTGFVYRNASIFYCNGGKRENFMPWTVTFGLSDKDNVSDINDLERYLTKATPSYKPPRSLTVNEYGFPCYQPDELTTRCDTDTAIKYPHLPLYCDSFTSYVATGYNKADKIYRNRHCFYCDSGPSDNFVPIFIPPLFPKDLANSEFSLTLSLSAENRISLEIEDRYRKIQWAESSCQLNVDALQGYANQCLVKVCDLQLQARPDGQCKALHNTYIAFDKEEFSLNSQEEEKQVSQFLRCGLNQYLDVEVVEINEPLIIQNDSNKNMYVANMSTYLPDLNSLSMADSNITEALTVLLNLLKTFRECRKPGLDSFCRSSVDKITNLTLMNKFITTTAHSNKLRFLDYSYVRDRDSSDRVIDHDNTTVCLGSSPVTYSSVEPLICVHEPLYESDLNRILDISNSTCFSIFYGNISQEWKTALAVKRDQSIVSFNWGNSVTSSVPLALFTFSVVAANTYCLFNCIHL